MYSRFHVEEVADCHISIRLSGTTALCEELVLSPGHVYPLKPCIHLFIYGGMRSRVPVMDELGLERRKEKQ